MCFPMSVWVLDPESTRVTVVVVGGNCSCGSSGDAYSGVVQGGVCELCMCWVEVLLGCSCVRQWLPCFRTITALLGASMPSCAFPRVSVAYHMHAGCHSCCPVPVSADG